MPVITWLIIALRIEQRMSWVIVTQPCSIDTTGNWYKKTLRSFGQLNHELGSYVSGTPEIESFIVHNLL